MSKGSSYSTELEENPIGIFIHDVKKHIEDLFNNHGHRDCGLVHEDVCKNIKDFIGNRKKSLLTKKGKNIVSNFNKDWERLKKKTYDDKFNEFGYENLCYPEKFKRNPRLRKLKTDFINFCQQKNVRKNEVKSDDFSSCTNYNIWINAQKNAFDRDYLQIVKELTVNEVTSYFRTKTQPKGFDPRPIYNSNKLNCKKLYSQSKKQPEKTGSALPIPPKSHEVTSGGKESKKTYTPITNEKTIITDTINRPNPSKSPSDNSQKDPSTLAKPKDVANGQDTNSRNRGTFPPVAPRSPTNTLQDALLISTGYPAHLPPPALSPPPTQIPQHTPVAQQTPDKQSIPVTHSATSPNITQSLSPDEVPPKTQPPDKAHHAPEPGSPNPVIKSPDLYPPPTTALDPGLASAPEAVSNSSESRTSSTVGSTTMDSTSGSPSAQDQLQITVPSQSTTTTSIVTTSINTQTTTAESGPSTTTVSAIVTQPIPSIPGNASTIEESEKVKAPLKTRSDPQDLISAFPKKQDDSTEPSIGAQSPGTPDPPVDPPHGPLLAALPSTPSFQLPTLSSGMSPDVSSAIQVVVNKPDDKKITKSTKDASPHSKGTTLVSSTPIPKVTYPSEKPSITPTEFPPLMNIIPTTLILLATLTILFLLYKYTPFGLFLGRRRKRKKFRTVFEIPEESTYESPNETIHEWDDHLGKHIMENDVYVKLLKMNRYKKEMQKKKKKRDTTLIEVHMEILEECKNDEGELHKGDFLEICLQEFINEKNRTKTNWPNGELTVNNIKNDKIIQDAEENEILWNFWIENYRNILESWKSEEWFQNLKNEWKKERQKNQNKIDEIEENTLKESGMISIECEKDIWKKWISKQATLIENFKQEDWFKSLIEEQDKEEDNYEINEYMNVLNTNMNEVEKEKKYREFFRKKNIINKLMVQMHMMVLEECKKEEIIENKELCIDNYIQNIHKKNNYDEKSNIQ